MNSALPFNPKQTGAAFVLLLMVVVVLISSTLLTMSSVNESNLQIMIARNMSERQGSLRNADSAAGVREQLSRLRAQRRCDPNLLGKLDKHMEHFDMGGIVHLLEAVEDAVE